MSNEDRTTNFLCELCRKRMMIDIDDPSTYISKTEDKNVMFGELVTVKTVHQKGSALHYNVVVLDQNGKYRAHADSYIEQKNKDPSEMNFLGRIAVIGQGGAGKTRTIQEMANVLAGKPIYSWSEEKNMAGTFTVTPYSLSFNYRMAVFNDNPGQSSQELVRRSVAQAGANYRGLLIFQDAVAWNFRDIGVEHGRVLTEYIKNIKQIPVVIITTKADLQRELTYSGVIERHASIIANAVATSYEHLSIGFFNRVKNQPREFKVAFAKGGAMYFTQLEQLIVNALQTDLRQNPIPGMSQINLRFYCRSILMGFAQLVIKWVEDANLGEIYPELNAFDQNLITALNYYRPTAYETESDWEVIHGVGKNEPVLLPEVLDEGAIQDVIRHFALGSEKKHNNYVKELRNMDFHNINPDVTWKIVDSVYTDTVSDEGKNKMYKAFETFIESVEGVSERKSLEVKDLNLQEFS